MALLFISLAVLCLQLLVACADVKVNNLCNLITRGQGTSASID